MTPQPLSLLYFSNAPVRGGVEEHILTLLRGLDRKLFRLHLVCPAECMEKLRPDLPPDVEALPLTLDQPTQLAAARRLAGILRARQVDILHSHMFQASLFASPLGWLSRAPVILETPHIRESWRHGWLKGSFVVDRLVGHFVDYYIAVSEANARYLVNDKGLPAKKIVVIQNGCDLERFHPDRPAPLHLKQSLGFDAGDPVLLVMARLEPQKGHSVLLKALPAIRAEFPRVRLVCAGEGSLRAGLEAEARDLGLEASARFVGHQANVMDWLALADATVLPSHFEGLPLAAIESLAAAKPMIATAVDGTPEVVVNGKTGLTVPPGDVSALAAAICTLLRDPALRRSLGQAGRQWVLDRFSREGQIRRTEELYLRVWSEKQARSKALGRRNPALQERTKGLEARLTSETRG